MIVVLTGRRIDAADAEMPRFPAAAEARVRGRIRQMLVDQAAQTLVSAAACGADLLALECAGELGIGRRVVLPFGTEQFRATSVVDRPGDWGMRFDRVIQEVEARGDLVILELDSADEEVYLSANRLLLEEALRVGQEAGKSVCAAVVWDGQAWGNTDASERFLREAQGRGLSVIEVPTMVTSRSEP